MKKYTHTFIIHRINKDPLTYCAKVRLNTRGLFKRKTFGLKYVPETYRPLKHVDNDYYIELTKKGGQTSNNIAVIFRVFRDFMRQNNINKENCEVRFK